jgi:pimeloyl-ACP methyl ester carboxylesterase
MADRRRIGLSLDGDVTHAAGGNVSKPQVADIEVRGTAIKTIRAGTGEPLLFLRGTDASDAWTPFLGALAENFDVIVPEHPGFGGRPVPPWLDTVSDLANFYLDLLDRLDLKRVHLAGTSLGGWIAANMAQRTCQRIASLTLVGAAGVRTPEAPAMDIFIAGEEAALRARFYDPVKADANVASLLTPETEDIRLSNAITIARVAWSPRLYDPHLMKWLHRITAPTLVVWGEHDRVLPRAHADYYAASIPGARQLIIQECGHWVAHERPDKLASAITEHAQSSRSAT